MSTDLRLPGLPEPEEPVTLTAAQMLERKQANRGHIDFALRPVAAQAIGEARRKAEEAVRQVETQLQLLRVVEGTDREPGALTALDRYQGAAAEAAERLKEVQEECSGSMARIVFEAIGGEAMKDLQRAHRPDKRALEEWREDLRLMGLPEGEPIQWHPNEFPPALIAESAVEPTFTLEEATELWTSPKWDMGVRALIFAKCYEVNLAG